MAKITQEQRPDRNDSSELLKRFNQFKSKEKVTGKPYRILEEPQPLTNQLEVKIGYPTHYSPNQNDEFWMMVTNHLSNHHLTVVNQFAESNGLRIFITLVEVRWHDFASKHEINTKSVVALTKAQQAILRVEFDVGSMTSAFENREHLIEALKVYRLGVVQEFDPQGLIGQLELQEIRH